MNTPYIELSTLADAEVARLRDQRRAERNAKRNGHDRPPQAEDYGPPLWTLPPAITEGEMAAARLTPRCIVEDYLFADVAQLVAPGSTGKTTMALYEAVHIVLGLPLWGLRVLHPGPVLFVTAEDRREFLVARLREIMAAMRLSPEQRAQVLEQVRIDDQTTKGTRLTAVQSDVVVPTIFPSLIVDECRKTGFRPALVQFDPMVSFGVGEARVNDAEQALVEAARIITAGLDCCTRYVHHTSKQVARDRIDDMYAGRGGGAMPDGCRMVHIMHSLDAAELAKLTGEGLREGQHAFVLARPKISYAPPNQPRIYVRRTNYAFEQVRALEVQTGKDRQRTIGEQVARFIEAEYRDGRRHSRNTLESVRPENLSTTDVRSGIAWLDASGRLRDESVIGPDGKPPAKGARKCVRAIVDGEPMGKRDE